MPGVFDAEGRVKLEHVSEVTNIPEHFKEASDSFLNLTVIKAASPKLRKTLYHMWEEAGMPYMVEHFEWVTKWGSTLPEGPRAFIKRGNRMTPPDYRGIMRDRGFDPPDTIHVRTDRVSDIIAELAHGYEGGVLREPARASRLLPEESLYDKFIQGIDWLRNKVSGDEVDLETVLDVLKEEHYSSMPDTVGQKLNPFWIDRKTGKIKRDIMAYEDPNLKRNQKRTRRAHEYVTHRIIEPWLYRRYQIDNLMDEWLEEE